MEELQVGQYILEQKLGEGGMAEVWKARNINLGNYAAIKFLTPRFAGNPEIEQRFLGEGKRQANLQHPNIVSALDFLYVDGRSYLVMKYINGEGLDQRLYRLQTPMPLAAALSISNDVLSALDYAHSEGVIHRDIKPSNILLETSGRAHVLDFGIALALGEQRVTRAGIAIGTPHYMSPEQIMGSKNFDHRSDIYSFGCVLYQMLTETPPFDVEEGEGDTEYFVKDQHLRRPPRAPRELNPKIPEHIERVVLRCLEKKAADRFDTCRDVMAALAGPTATAAKAPERPATVFEQPQFSAPSEAWPARTPTPAPMAAQQPSPAPPTYPSGPGVGPSMPPTVLPPAAPARAGIPGIVWALGGLVIVLALAGAGYWYSQNNHTESAKTAEQKPVVPPPSVTPKPETAKTTTPPPAALRTVKTTQAKMQKPLNTATAPRRPVATPTQSDVASLPSKNDTPPPAIPERRPEQTPAPLAPSTGKAPGTGNASSAQSGVLRCSGNPVYQNGQVVFANLPNKRLRFTWDRAKWRIFMRNLESGGRELVLVSLSPDVQRSCEVQWQVVQ